MTAMQKYLEESGRTAPTEVSVRDDVFRNHAHFMYDLMMLVEAGGTADIIKRSLFYKEPVADSKVRSLQTMGKNRKLYDKINVELLLSDKPDTKSEGPVLSDDKIHLIHACFGLISEAGEVLEEVIKSTLENRDMDTTNLKEEGGDFLWYLAYYLRTLKTTFEIEAQRNTDKLTARFPDKFTSEAALNRDLDNERQVLEKESA